MSNRETIVETGEFPFPLTDGPDEPRYLTWIRNHSNYMAERGFLDYFRLIGVLIRGILINFLTLLPYLLLVSIIIAVAYKAMLIRWDSQLTVAGVWSDGGTLTTTVTRIDEDGAREAEQVVTSVAPGAATPSAVRDLHHADLVKANGLFAEFTWSKSDHPDKIVVAPAKKTELPASNGAVETAADTPDIVISVTDTAAEGAFTRMRPAPLPFLGTPIVFVIAIVCVLLFPIAARLLKVVRYRQTLATGSTSSVKLRDRSERVFGGLLLAILLVVVIETLPLLVHLFHQFRGDGLGWSLPTVAGAVGVLIAANKILPLLRGIAKKLALVFVGAIGLLVPLLVVLFVVEFLVYSDEPYVGFLNLGLILFPVAIGAAIILAMFLGIGSFKWRGYGRLFVLLGMVLSLSVVAVVLIFWSDDLGASSNLIFVAAWAANIAIFCSLAVDVNLTSVNGLYRDRLASAFLVGRDIKGDVDIEQDIDLQEICNYDAGCTAPYHLVNVTINLQGSKDIGIRDRNSDFFIFSKKFIGSSRTGYCRSENMEQVYPQIDLGTAMAISAAAAAPNMGKGTNPLMVAFLTLLNVRLGFWVPNPGRLVRYFSEGAPPADEPKPGDEEKRPPRLEFDKVVFPEEVDEIRRRREEAGQSKERPIDKKQKKASTAMDLVGIGFSGGGIRSATINLGIAQALHEHGIFDHIDYMSTVSGGGYLGSSISTLMRYKKQPAERDVTHKGRSTLMNRYDWRVRPKALFNEMISGLDETGKWVNLSDGGHIENLAAIELLRRKCKYIIIGDGEADPKLYFNGLATLIRYARIDLGIDIEIDVEDLRLKGKEKDKDRRSGEHFATGRIWYPGCDDCDRKRDASDKESGKSSTCGCGYLLYLKSSFTGDEDEVITEYRHRKPAFPHESTADQFFDEGQFEAYRALGQHIGEKALAKCSARVGDRLPFPEVAKWFKTLLQKANEGTQKRRAGR